jgi:hypothetical protein
VHVPLDTDAALRLWLAPDWARPETWLGALSTYIRVAHPEGSTCLCLAAGDTPADAVAALVATACERLSGDQPFADVLIVAAPGAPADVIPVASADGVRAALAAPPWTGPSDRAAAAALAAELRELAGAPAATGDEAWLRDVIPVVPYA